VNITILPKTYLGKWSIVLTSVFILIFVLADVLFGYSEPDPNSIPSSAIIATICLAIVAAGALITGLIGMIKLKERSILVLFAMVISTWVGLVGALGSLFIL
jgi:hypothetical protein